MNKSFIFLVLISFLSFLGCSDNDEEIQNQYGPMKRNITQSDIDCLKYVTVYNYDIGWNFLKFSPSSKGHFDPESKNIDFFIDLDEKGKMKDGTYKCKDTESFKKFANFKCNEVDYEPNDVIQITKNSENNYTISFSFVENEQLFQGTYTGVVDYVGLAIDYIKECY